MRPASRYRHRCCGALPHPQRAGPEEGPGLRARLDALVARLVANYSSRHAALLAEILPEGAAGAAAGGGFDGAGLAAFVERLSDFDVEMNGVAVDSGILAGEGPRLPGGVSAAAL
jgi:hypothetical protein